MGGDDPQTLPAGVGHCELGYCQIKRRHLSSTHPHKGFKGEELEKFKGTTRVNISVYTIPMLIMC